MLLWNKMTDMDEHAFKGFVELYTSDLLYYAQYIVRSKEEAEEIVSDVFVTVWQNRNKIREIEHVKAWLLTITHNQAVSYLRKKNHAVSSVTWEEMGENAIPADLQTPDERLISQEEMSRINHAIHTLPPRCRQVFVLAKIEKLLYKDIAGLLGISVKTINMHIASALERISEAMEK